MREDQDIMDAEQAAALLKVSVQTLYKLAQGGKLPARKVGREWRFSRRALERWLAGSG